MRFAIQIFLSATALVDIAIAASTVYLVSLDWLCDTRTLAYTDLSTSSYGTLIEDSQDPAASS